jgi:hypothetical protein
MEFHESPYSSIVKAADVPLHATKALVGEDV